MKTVHLYSAYHSTALESERVQIPALIFTRQFKSGKCFSNSKKKASDKTFVFQQSSVFDKPIFPDVKQFLNKFWNSLSLHNDTLTKSNSWTMSVNSGTATVNTLQLLKVFSGFEIDYTDCVKRTIKLHACYRRTGLIDEPMYWFCWEKVLKCCSVW